MARAWSIGLAIGLWGGAAAGAGEGTIPLWPAGAPGAKGSEPGDVPTLERYGAPEEIATGAAVIVCPGGGYGTLAAHEAGPIAEWLNGIGIHAFVLRYRHAPRYGHPAPLQDASRAIRTVRARGAEWRIDPRRIGIIGFSAGGHLAATAGTHVDAGDPGAQDPIERVSSRPDAMILVYPVVTMGEGGQAGSRRNLLGPDPDPALVALLSNERHVTKDTPPVFLVHGIDDAVVPCEESLRFAEACRRAGVPHELHLYEHGPHGFGLGGRDPALASWPRRCADWLRRRGFVAPPASAPAPLPPVPTPEQLAWQEAELILFLHFGMNTFTDREWGDGKEDPKLFHPTAFDARQWARVAKEAGFRWMILTAKHHDGFCLWPTAQTDHSVRASAWREGKGDAVGEVARAAREAGLRFGFYLSPWDRHEPRYADSAAYDAFFRAQLEELLTRYGEIAEVWFDGAGGEGHVYDFPSYYDTVRRLAPGAVIAICGPDVRWVGNESGVARETEWSVQPAHPVFHRGREGQVWYPAECDVSIRPGWFWHAREDSQVKSLDRLLEIYYTSVGRNSVLLLNVPPNDRGLIPEPDAARLREWRAVLDATFALDLARGGRARASAVRGRDPAFGAQKAIDGDPETYWATDDEEKGAALEIDLEPGATFDVARIEEAIALGQRVEAYRIEALVDGAWREIAKGTTIGRKKLDRFGRVTATKVRLVIERSRACPAIRSFGLHLSPR